IRLIDFLKESGVTAFYTSLVSDTGGAFAESQVGVSSLMDSWLLLSNLEANGERTRALQVIKSRGMPHSNLVREFVFSEHGIDLVDVYLASGRILAVPTLVRKFPEPIRKIIGDLSNEERVLVGLDVKAVAR